MGITETRSRAVAATPAATTASGAGASAATLPMAGELVQDRVARQRLEKRLKRRRVMQQRQRQNAVVGCVLLTLLLVVAYWGYRGWVQVRNTGARVPLPRPPVPHDAKSLIESFRRFQKDAPHARHSPQKEDEEGGGAGSNEKVNPKNETPQERIRRLEAAFAQVRHASRNDRVGGGVPPPSPVVATQRLREWADQVNQDIHDNVDGGIRFIRSYLLPPLRDAGAKADPDPTGRDRYKGSRLSNEFKMVHRRDDGTPMRWETEWKDILKRGEDRGPAVDYTDPNKYRYPQLEPDPPSPDKYPVFTPLGELMDRWNHHDDYDGIFEETLMHFNYSNPAELEMARVYREKQLPFKLYDVPELQAAGEKWTDEYVNEHFSHSSGFPRSNGMAQESPNHYFAFFIPQKWNVMELGLPPTVENDWSYGKWAEHARYADSVRLSPHQPHFYWQSGVPPTERHLPKDDWTFISRDVRVIDRLL
jgi:hypothetical protein